MSKALFALVGACGLLLASNVAAQEAADADSQKEAPADGGGARVLGQGGPAVVTVESVGDSVTVSEITGRMAATGVAGGTSVVVAGVSYRDLCQTPCSFEVNSGLLELGVHGEGVSGATKQFNFTPGANRVQVDPGSSGLAVGGYVAAVLGFTAAITGVVFIFVSDDIMDFPALPLTLIGVGTTGAGIGMMVAGSTSLEKVGSETHRPEATAQRPLGLALHGQF